MITGRFGPLRILRSYLHNLRWTHFSHGWLGLIFLSANSLEFKIPTENHPVPSPASDADISPDGNWLVFEAWPEGNNHDIYIMNFSGDKVARLTDAISLDFQPAWRP